jgi:hypothetical protein
MFLNCSTCFGRHTAHHQELKYCNCSLRVVEFIIPMFLNCSTCVGRHTAHYQKLKYFNCSLWFYIRFWLPVAAAMAEPSQRCTGLDGTSWSSIQTCTLDGHQREVTYTRCLINTIDSPDDEHRGARNM